VGTCGNDVPINFFWCGKAFSHHFALVTVLEAVRSNRSHSNMAAISKRASNMQIHATSKKSTVKQKDPV